MYDGRLSCLRLTAFSWKFNKYYIFLMCVCSLSHPNTRRFRLNIQSSVTYLVVPYFPRERFLEKKVTEYEICLKINQLDALNFIMSLLHSSTCFQHMCSSSGVQNCTIQSLVSSHLQVAVPCTVLSQPVHGTTTYKCDDTRGCIVQF